MEAIIASPWEYLNVHATFPKHFRAHFIVDPFFDDALFASGLEILQRFENVETFNRRSGHSNYLSCGKFTQCVVHTKMNKKKQQQDEVNKNDSINYQCSICAFSGPIPFPQREYVRWYRWI